MMAIREGEGVLLETQMKQELLGIRTETGRKLGLRESERSEGKGKTRDGRCCSMYGTRGVKGSFPRRFLKKGGRRKGYHQSSCNREGSRSLQSKAEGNSGWKSGET